MTYEELKIQNRKAHSALISLWEELSRVSRAAARKDLKADWSVRYSVVNLSGKVRVWKYPSHNLITKEYSLQFTDSHAGQSFHYVEDQNEWV